ncbi:MAG: bile acid:sodium symporter [Deltaproteobacteria bacterium]|nr:MAG: bile acid:sodium symporter [Deltaproteobacteria bacterium]
MIQRNDLVLLLVIVTSMAAGIAFPEQARFLQPYPLYLMMFQLFFTFIKIEFGEVFRNIGKNASLLFVLSLTKILLIPALLFFLTEALWPKYAIPVLLLSGISTGVVAPFVADLLGASMTPVLMMVVVSSLLVPFSLPALVSLLTGGTLDISFLSMVKILFMVIFTPAACVVVMRRLIPSFLEKLQRVQFSLSLAFFALINLGVFSKYSSYFLKNPIELAGTVLVAFALSIACHLIGFLVTWGREKGERLAGAVSFSYLNGILVIGFASQFFGPLAAALAVAYMLPFFVLIVPARIAGNLLK